MGKLDSLRGKDDVFILILGVLKMQINVFTIPICDPENVEKELNVFMRGNRVLDVVCKFVDDGANSRWSVLVKTLGAETKSGASNSRRNRVDYKDILDEESFSRFCALRKARKAVADAEGVPAFALFTDKHMAGLSRISHLTLESMKTEEGIGSGKTDKYGQAILRVLAEQTDKIPDQGQS